MIAPLTLMMLIISTSTHERCGTDEYMALQLRSNPEFSANLKRQEQLTKSIRAADSRTAPWTGSLQIPTVIHVLYDTEASIPGYEQIMSQFIAGNRDYMELNTDIGDVVSDFTSVITNYSMTYHLSEIITVQTAITCANDGQYKHASTADGGSDIVDSEHHLNIWICTAGVEGSTGGSLLGFAQLPGGNAATDGAVITWDAFGTSEYDYASAWVLSGSYHLGRTFTHEIGHWLNLYHTFQGGCANSDGVDDTPATESANTQCTVSQSTCGSLDMLQNYMDYGTDDCLLLFTDGQFARSSALMESGGLREGLIAYIGQGTESFVSSIYFVVDNVCAPNDVKVEINLNDGHATANVITACVSYTTNGYVKPITDIAIATSPSNCGTDTWYQTETNLNYGVTASGVTAAYLCFEKGETSTAHADRVQGFTFFGFANAQTETNYNGYILILDNVNFQDPGSENMFIYAATLDDTTSYPTNVPTQYPTKTPQAPSKTPSQSPSKTPMQSPTNNPAQTENPTSVPTGQPTSQVGDSEESEFAAIFEEDESMEFGNEQKGYAIELNFANWGFVFLFVAVFGACN